MKSAKLTAIKTIEIANVAEPAISCPKDIKVKVKAVGICGTDLHIFSHGRADVAFPRVMGHELSGEVVEVGAEVTEFKTGDKVILDPVFACGTCPTCQKGYQNVCSNVACYGVQMEGGYSEYIVEEARHFYKVPEKISYDVAALAEPFSIAANILDRAGCTEKDNVIIIGSGTIGLALVQAAKGIGAKVLVADVVDPKLAKAKEFGADVICNSKTEDLGAKATEMCPDGFDVVIDAVGIAPLFLQSIDYAAPRARVMSIGFIAEPVGIPPIVITKKELSIIGSRMNNFMFPKVIEWLENDKIQAEKMISKKYSIDDIQQAFEDTLNDGANTIKTLITF